MAGDERIELPTKVLETPIIPFNYAPRPIKKEFLQHINNNINRTIFQEKHIIYYECSSV